MIALAMTIVYSVAVLLVGVLIKRRRAKDKTIRNFFVANGSMSLFAVTAMLFGDLIAASTTTGTAGTGYSTGFAALWGIWGSSFGCLVFSFCFCRFFFEIRKTGAITGPEAFGIRFNQKIRYLVLVFTLIPLFIVFSTQVTAASMYLSSMLGVEERVATAIVFVVFLAMALLGITGVAEMNKVHSFVLLFGLTFAALVCINHVGGPQVLVQELPSSYFNPFVKGVPTVMAQFLGGALGFSISVTSINIAYCAKSIKVAEQSHVIVAVLSALFVFAPMSIGLCAAVSLDDIRADNALYLMTGSVSPELAGLAVMAVFAAILSTAPWFLLSTANLIVRELCIPIAEARGKTISDTAALRISRATIVIALICGVAISGTNVSLLNSLLGASQIKAISVVLLLFGIYWKRTSNAAGFAGLLVGGTLSTLWYILSNPFDVQPFWPGIISSVIIIVIGSLLCSKGPVSKDYVSYQARLVRAQDEFKEYRELCDEANLEEKKGSIAEEAIKPQDNMTA